AGPAGPPPPKLPVPVLAPPRPPRPPPRPPCPPWPPLDPLGAVAAPALWLRATRCGSSLSASLSFHWPLKSIPRGGANASFSLAQAETNNSATTHTTRMSHL